MYCRIFLMSLLSFDFCARVQGVLITVTNNTSTLIPTTLSPPPPPASRSSPSPSPPLPSHLPVPTLTLNCTPQGTRSVRRVTSFKITSRPYPSSTKEYVKQSSNQEEEQEQELAAILSTRESERQQQQEWGEAVMQSSSGAGANNPPLPHSSSSSSSESSGSGNRSARKDSSETSSGSGCRNHIQVIQKTGAVSEEYPQSSFLSVGVRLDTRQKGKKKEKKKTKKKKGGGPRVYMLHVTCYMYYRNHVNAERVDSASTVVSEAASVAPGPVVITTHPAPDTNPSPTPAATATVTAPVATDLHLTCWGQAGSEPHDVEIVWQWAAVDNGPFTSPPDPAQLRFTHFVPKYMWDRVLDTTITTVNTTTTTDKTTTTRPKPTGTANDRQQSDSNSSSSSSRGCSSITPLTVVRSTVIRVVTEADRYRTYRCYPRLVRRGQDLVHLAASVLVITDLPRIQLKTYPTSTEFAGGNSVPLHLPLRVQCLEIHRPLEPPADVRIRLVHNDKVILSVCGEMGQQCDRDDDATSVDDDVNVIQNNTNLDKNKAIHGTERINNGENENNNESSSSKSRGENNSQENSNNHNDITTNVSNNDADTFTESTDTANSYRTSKESSRERAAESAKRDNRKIGEAEEQWEPDVRYNTDVTSVHMLYVCLTLYNLTCHSGGSYRCIFDYLMEGEGADPFILTQVAEVYLPVQVSPQKPNITVNKKLLQYPVGTNIEVRCSSFIGGPELTADWTWQICHYGSCSPTGDNCLSKTSCYTEYQSEVTVAEYVPALCQYKQTSSVRYSFKIDDVGVTEVRCYVTRLNASYWPVAMNFTTPLSRSHMHGSGVAEGEVPNHDYRSPLTIIVLPVALILSVVVAFYLLISVTRRRYQRLKRRLRVQSRKSISRTDHFRKRPRVGSATAENTSAWRARKLSVLTFGKAALTVLLGMTEQEVEEKEKKQQQNSHIRRKSCPAATTRRTDFPMTTSRRRSCSALHRRAKRQRRRSTSLPGEAGTRRPAASKATPSLITDGNVTRCYRREGRKDVTRRRRSVSLST